MSFVMTSRLILTADDFGVSDSVNTAVQKARKTGLLTNASLMVAGQFVREAISIARDDTELAVGLHLTLSHGAGILPYEQIPNAIKENGSFTGSPIVAGFKYFFDTRARRQLRSEIEAQFDRFACSGLLLSHVDGHQHLHAHPAVLPVVIEFAKKYGACGIRVPRDPFWINMRVDHARLHSKIFIALGHAYLSWVCDKNLYGSGLETCNTVIGAMMSGNMRSEYVMQILDLVHTPRIEVYFHPSTQLDSASPQGPNPGDLNTLLDPRLKQFIADRKYDLTSYANLHNSTDNAEDH